MQIYLKYKIFILILRNLVVSVKKNNTYLRYKGIVLRLIDAFNLKSQR